MGHTTIFLADSVCHSNGCSRLSLLSLPFLNSQGHHWVCCSFKVPLSLLLFGSVWFWRTRPRMHWLNPTFSCATDVSGLWANCPGRDALGEHGREMLWLSPTFSCAAVVFEHWAKCPGHDTLGETLCASPCRRGRCFRVPLGLLLVGPFGSRHGRERFGWIQRFRAPMSTWDTGRYYRPGREFLGETYCVSTCWDKFGTCYVHY